MPDQSDLKKKTDQKGRARSFMRNKTFCSLAALSLTTLILLPACLQRPVQTDQPSTTNIFVDRIENQPIEKIDLLFVVDNSSSMGDKQKIFEKAVPQMLERLVQPDCVSLNADGEVIAREKSKAPSKPGEDPTCSGELVLEFNPVNDIHIGVISSSLGSSGGTICEGPEQNDRALLMPRVRAGVVDPHDTGFLVWHPAEEDDPLGTPVEDNLENLKANFQEHVLAAGEAGCGFEAPLEAAYRFLIDPSPASDFVLVEDRAQSTGPDLDVLAQREHFLRPDSLVGVVLLTDENDCSVMGGGNYYERADLGWFATSYVKQVDGKSVSIRMPIATEVCETNPNDPCCFSCSYTETPEDCKDQSARDVCLAQDIKLKPEEDRPNTRCFNEQGRFGIDLLYPTSRYVDGFTKGLIIDSQTGEEVKNPLLWGTAGDSPRGESLVYFATIAGIPWQDLADEKSLSDDSSLNYLKASSLNDKDVLVGEEKVDRWQIMLGTKGFSPRSHECRESGNALCGVADVPPLDPFLVESIHARVGTNPLTRIGPTTSPEWNPVNGHEHDNSIPYSTEIGGGDSAAANNDLQHSCTFPLEPYGGVRDCADSVENCDCQHEPSKGRSLCKETPTSAPSTTQHFGKAYPPTRLLEVLKGVGANSIPGSICPKIHDPESKDFGYNPSVSAIIDRLAERLKGQCLPRQLTLDTEGLVECLVVEAVKGKDGGLDCDTEGRSALVGARHESIEDELLRAGWCANKAECSAATLCAVTQLEKGADREACLTAPIGAESDIAPGYCYIEAERKIGDASLVAGCPDSQRQLLRFVGKDRPAPDSTTFIACSADLASKADVVPAAPRN